MREKNNPHLLRNWLVLFIFLAVVFFGIKGYFNHQLSSVSSDTTLQAFTISQGEGTSAIANALEEKGLIRSSFFFKIALKLEGTSGKIEAGDFQLSPSMSAEEIIKALAHGGGEDRSVTIIEGLRNEEVAKKLSQGLGINEADFLAVAKQGYMFPDTYSFSKKATSSDIVKIMEDNFNKKYTLNLQNKIQALGLTPTQGVNLAAIVEREGRSDGVRTQVASILLKRLNMGMALDADATIQYALGYSTQEKSWWRKNISADDLKIKSPFNTYINPGLPPIPICNPSVSSLEAVANANPNTPYLYYYHDSKGNSYYSKTLDEQNINVAKHP